MTAAPDYAGIAKRLTARDERAREEGGDYLYRGPGDELSREAAAAITDLLDKITWALRNYDAEKNERETAEAALAAANAEKGAVEGQLRDEQMEHNLLKELLSRPEIDDFYEGVLLEAAHQRQRWSDAHDRSKSAENWYWLVGYLAGKALRSAIQGDQVKARHHTISSAAALFQWHKAIGSSPNGEGLDADLTPALSPSGDRHG